MAPQHSGPKVLLVDDDNAFRSVYARLLKQRGYVVVEADDRSSARSAFDEGAPDAVLLDLMLPPDGSAEGGVAQLREMLERRPDTKVIVVSGAGDTRAMLDAVREGAHDFLTKPVNPDVLLVVVQRALARSKLEREVAALRRRLQEERAEGALIGRSPRFAAAVDLARQVAPSKLPVLVLGENGTGKEMLARLIHGESDRRQGPFVAVNCGAIVDTLYESTLFGHRKGAFTGAVCDQPGLFQRASGGTLFLDEVGDMPLAQQVKLLRVLESGEVLPVGAVEPVPVDVRVVSATNQDLGRLLTRGEFREDLFWRLKGAEVLLPPLRERRSDIGLLAAHFLDVAAALTPTGEPLLLGESAYAALEQHAWPGNLRELRNEMQRATVLARGRRRIEASDLSFGSRSVSGGNDDAPSTLPEKVEALERREIERALERFHGNRTHAADALGLSRQGLLKKMHRYGFC